MEIVPQDILLFIGMGALAGFFAGLLGIGGGVIITPLFIVMYSTRLPPEHLTHIAIATSLAVISATAIPSAFVHSKNGGVIWRLGFIIAAGAMAGAWIFALLVAHISGMILNVLLVIFLLRVSYRMFFNAAPLSIRLPFLPSPLPPIAAGFGIGSVSAIFGIGGGMLSVPYLTARGIDIRHAIGTSAFIGAPLAWSAAMSYSIAPVVIAANVNDINNTAENIAQPLSGMLGYIFLPAALGIAIASMIFAVVGARLTKHMPHNLLRKIFAMLTFAVSMRLLFGIL